MADRPKGYLDGFQDFIAGNSATGDPILDLRNKQETEDHRVATGFVDAAQYRKVTPEETGARIDLSVDTGIAIEDVDVLGDEVRQQFETDQRAEVARNLLPETKRWIAGGVQNAAVAVDILGPLNFFIGEMMEAVGPAVKLGRDIQRNWIAGVDMLTISELSDKELGGVTLTPDEQNIRSRLRIYAAETAYQTHGNDWNTVAGAGPLVAQVLPGVIGTMGSLVGIDVWKLGLETNQELVELTEGVFKDVPGGFSFKLKPGVFIEPALPDTYRQDIIAGFYRDPVTGIRSPIARARMAIRGIMQMSGVHYAARLERGMLWDGYVQDHPEAIDDPVIKMIIGVAGTGAGFLEGPATVKLVGAKRLLTSIPWFRAGAAKSLRKLTKSQAVLNLMKLLGINYLREGGTEAAQFGITDGLGRSFADNYSSEILNSENWSLDRPGLVDYARVVEGALDQTFSEETLNGMIEQYSGGGVIGVAFGILPGGLRLRGDLRLAAESNYVNGKITNAVNAGKATKLKDRSIRAYASAIAVASRGGEVTDARFSARKWVGYWLNQGEETGDSRLDPKKIALEAGVSEEAYDRAVESDEDIHIPIEFYVANIAHQHHATLGRDASFRDGHMTDNELSKFVASARGEVVAEAAEAERQSLAVKDALDAHREIQNDLSEQLAAAGAFLPAQREAQTSIWASAYVVMAQRSGQDARDLYFNRRPEITSVLQEQRENLERAATDVDALLLDSPLVAAVIFVPDPKTGERTRFESPPGGLHGEAFLDAYEAFGEEVVVEMVKANIAARKAGGVNKYAIEDGWYSWRYKNDVTGDLEAGPDLNRVDAAKQGVKELTERLLELGGEENATERSKVFKKKAGLERALVTLEGAVSTERLIEAGLAGDITSVTPERADRASRGFSLLSAARIAREEREGVERALEAKQAEIEDQKSLLAHLIERNADEKVIANEKAELSVLEAELQFRKDAVKDLSDGAPVLPEEVQKSLGDVNEEITAIEANISFLENEIGALQGEQPSDLLGLQAELEAEHDALDALSRERRMLAERILKMPAVILKRTKKLGQPEVAPASSEEVFVGVRREARAQGRVRWAPGEQERIVDQAELLGLDAAEITAYVEGRKRAHPAYLGFVNWVYNQSVPRKQTPKQIADGAPLVYVHEPHKVGYSYDQSAEGNELLGAPRTRAIHSMSDKMVDLFLDVFTRDVSGDLSAKEILSQAKWYREMRRRIRREFGGLGDLFADLLGATSPQTTVRDNFQQAIVALRQATTGAFDELMPQWEAWVEASETADQLLREWWDANRQPDGRAKKTAEYQQLLKDAKSARKLPEALKPKKPSGALFGINSVLVVRTMVNTFRVIREKNLELGIRGTQPKTINFSGNFAGFSSAATIDRWAARLLQRLKHGNVIPVQAEIGVTGTILVNGETRGQFGFGQDVFAAAAKKIRVHPVLSKRKDFREIGEDDLQAVMWFIEKEWWTRHNITSALGEEGDMALELSTVGPVAEVRDEIAGLQKIKNSSKSTDAEKAAAIKGIASRTRQLDRFIGGLSTARPGRVPGDAEMAAVGANLQEYVLDQDPNASVVGVKMFATEGLYGETERSLDIEVVVDESFNPNPLWNRMLEIAREADQESMFLARTLRDDELANVDPLFHRPGLEIYLKNPVNREDAQVLLDELSESLPNGYTVSTDARRSSTALAGKQTGVVGFRAQYIPEFSDADAIESMSDAELSEHIMKQSAILAEQVREITKTRTDVAVGQLLWHETRIAFSHEYAGEIDGREGTQREGDTGSRQEVWRGRSVREGAAAARTEARNRQAANQRRQPIEPAGPEAPTQLDQPTQSTPGFRAQVEITDAAIRIRLGENFDLSSFAHEMGHVMFDVMSRLVTQPGVDGQMLRDHEILTAYGNKRDATWERLAVGIRAKREDAGLSTTDDAFFQEVMLEKVNHALEGYLLRGESPSIELSSAFKQFKEWMKVIYQNWQQIFGEPPPPDVIAALDRWFATDAEIDALHTAPSAYANTLESIPEEDMVSVTTPEERAEILAMMDRSRLEAEEQAVGNAIEIQLRIQAQDIERRRERISQEVEAQMRADPMIQLQEWLATGEWISDLEMPAALAAIDHAKLDTNLLPEDQRRAVPKRYQRKRTKKVSAWDVAEIAPLWGIESHQLILALIERGKAETYWSPGGPNGQGHFVPKGPSLEALVAEETAARLTLELESDGRSDQDYAIAAFDAVHNDSRGWLLAKGLEISRRLEARDVLRGTAQRQVGQDGPRTARERYQVLVSAQSDLASAQQAKMEAGAERGSEEALLANDRINTAALRVREAEELQEAASHARRGERAALQQQRALGVQVADIRREAQARVADTPYGEQNPSGYAAAERHAADAYARAAIKKQWSRAAEAKERMLYHHFAYQAAIRERKKADRQLRYIGRLTKLPAQRRLGLASVSHRTQLNDLLVRYGFMSPGEAARVAGKQNDALDLAVFAAQEATGYDVVMLLPDTLTKGKPKGDWLAMTPAELTGLVDVLRNLEALAKANSDNHEMIDGIQFDESKRAMLASSQNAHPDAARLPKRKRDAQGQEHYVNKAWRREAKQKSFEGMRALLSKQEFVMEFLDGEGSGAWWKFFFNPLNRAESHRLRLRKDVSQATADAWNRAYPIEGLTDIAGRRARASVSMTEIFIEEWDLNMSRENLIVLAMNQGAEDNQARVVEGMPWTQQEITRVLHRELSRKDWRLASDLIQIEESMWPALAALDLETNGVVAGKIPGQDLDTPFGPMPGGYHHIEYDAKRSIQASNIGEPGVLPSARLNVRTAQGASNARVGLTGKPVDLRMSVFVKHMSEVTHDLSYRKAIKAAARILKDPELQVDIVEAGGRRMFDEMVVFLNRVAHEGQHIPPQIGDGWLMQTRIGFTVYAMAWKFTVAAMQPVGITITVNRLKNTGTNSATHLKTAVEQYYRGYVRGQAVDSSTVDKWTEFIASRSDFMDNRWNQSERDIRTIADRNQGGEMFPEWTESYFWMMKYMDMQVSSVSWMAAYAMAISGDANNVLAMDEVAAIDYADMIVRTSQGSGAPKDLATVQDSTEMWRAFTTFYSYQSVVINNYMVDTEFGAGASRVAAAHLRPKMVATSLLLWVIPEVIIGVMLQRIPGIGGDDDQDLKTFTASQTVNTLAGMFPVGREIGPLMFDSLIGIRTGDYSPTPADSYYGEASKLLAAMPKGKVSDSIFRSAAVVLGVRGRFPGAKTPGLPGAQLYTTVEAAVHQGVFGHDRSVLDYLRLRRNRER